MSDATTATTPRKLSLWTKLAYGFGAVAYGVKNNGFDYFLLLFYGVVVGLDERLVGLALLIALVFDAISDPLVGYWSDNFRSKWGRRHPFMYAAAIPVAVTFYFLWNPPLGWSDTGLFIYMTFLSILIRTLITFYETPSAALAPDMTSDYDERTKLFSYRYMFGWVGGNLMTVLMFGALLVAVPKFNFNPYANMDGWRTYGVIASTLMFAAIIISAIGTHSQIPTLRKAPEKRRLTPATIFKEIFETLSNRSFSALFVGALFGAIATGVSAALSFIILPIFWGFSSIQLFVWSLFVFAAAISAFIITPIIARRLGKKRAAISLGIVAFLMAPLPVFLRLIDMLYFGKPTLLPPNGGEGIFTPIFTVLLIVRMLDLALIISFQILFSSMIADLVEQSELKTNRRSEGLFIAAVTFIRKCVQGLGVLIAGFIVFLAGFPDETSRLNPPKPGELGEDVLIRLGGYYAPTLLFLYLAMIIAVSFYKIDRSGHEENLRKLSDRQSS